MADFSLPDFLTAYHRDCKPRDILRAVQRCAQIEPYGYAMRVLTVTWHPDLPFYKDMKRNILNPPPRGAIVINPAVTYMRKRLQRIIRMNYPHLLEPTHG